jgi:hypothetical protein
MKFDEVDFVVAMGRTMFKTPVLGRSRKISNIRLVSTWMGAACSRSQWPRGIRHELSSFDPIRGSWVRIQVKAWMSVCVCFVFVFFCV